MAYTPTPKATNQTLSAAEWTSISNEVGALSGWASGSLSVAESPYMSTGPSSGDDTALIEQASSTGKWLRPGYYSYSGPGITGYQFRLTGDPQSEVRIDMSPGTYLINPGQVLARGWLRNINTTGGAGIFRNTFTGGNVQETFLFENCRFIDYSACAISHNSSDMPNWKIDNCLFRGANSTSTIGIALSGLTNESDITMCIFDRYKVAIKLDNGGCDVHIDKSLFIQAEPGGDRIAIWLVPRPDVGSGIERHAAGQGFVLSQCKFGSEFRSASDYGVVIAAEGSGATFGERLPAIAPTNGWVNGTTIRDVNYGGSDTSVRALVYTCTPNWESAVVADIQLISTRPTYIVEWMAGAHPVTDTRNVIGPARLQWPNDTQKVTNVPEHVHIIDHAGQLLGTA